MTKSRATSHLFCSADRWSKQIGHFEINSSTGFPSQSLLVMASKLSTSYNIKCLLVGLRKIQVWFRTETELLNKFCIPWFCIVALCEHSEHKLTRFNFVKHNGCIDNARGTIRGLGHIGDYWGLGCGAFVAEFCWNLFKESGIGILSHNLPQGPSIYYVIQIWCPERPPPSPL